MFSKVLRRTHLYLALFLAPWVLIYAASTFVMNHREFFRGKPPAPPRWVKLAEKTYDGSFAPGADRFQMARQILQSLDMDGAHQPTLRDGTLVIQRLDAVNPKRISVTLGDKKLVIEEQARDTTAFLERMHRRRGFQHPYGLDDAWAVSVDVFVAAVVFWTLSGLWLWWELRVTRRWGAWFALAGSALFCFFLAVL